MEQREQQQDPADGRGGERTEDGKVRVPRPRWSGVWNFTAVPIKEDEPDQVDSGNGRPGMYQITYALLDPTTSGFAPNVHLPGLFAAAESLVQLPQGVTSSRGVLYDDAHRVEVAFHANASGRVATAELRLFAANFQAAEHMSYSIVAPILSWFAFRCDVEVDLAGFRIVEEATGSTKHQVGLLGQPSQLPAEMLLSRPAYRRILAAYREGLNSRNPFFQFLSFFKVAEATRRLRDQRAVDARAKGETFTRPVETIPESESDLSEVPETYREHLRPFLGKKYTAVLDAFRALMRNALAHLDPDGDTLNADLATD